VFISAFLSLLLALSRLLARARRTMAATPPASRDVIPVTMLSGFLGAGE
jgi:hypothetical protein